MALVILHSVQHKQVNLMSTRGFLLPPKIDILHHLGTLDTASSLISTMPFLKK